MKGEKNSMAPVKTVDILSHQANHETIHLVIN